MSLRISTTTLESWRLYRETDWMTEGKLVAQIKGAFTPTPEILQGIAFEKILRDPEPYRFFREEDRYMADGVVFGADVIKEALTHIPKSMLWQVKGTKVYEIDGEPVLVVGKTDGFRGRQIAEIKTTGSFQIDKYLGSLQWRLYLDIFGASSVTYIVFVLRYRKREGAVALVDTHTFDCLPYNGMATDIREALTSLVSFVRLRGLEEYFAPKLDMGVLF